MPYAAEGQISKRPIDEGVEISDEKYDEARSHALSGGLIKAHNGTVVLTIKPEKKEGHKEPVWQDGDWYHEPEPEETQTEKDAERISEIKSELQRLDLESVRPLRAINVGTDTAEDRDRLAELDAEAESLRKELDDL